MPRKSKQKGKTKLERCCICGVEMELLPRDSDGNIRYNYKRPDGTTGNYPPAETVLLSPTGRVTTCCFPCWIEYDLPACAAVKRNNIAGMADVIQRLERDGRSVYVIERAAQVLAVMAHHERS